MATCRPGGWSGACAPVPSRRGGGRADRCAARWRGGFGRMAAGGLQGGLPGRCRLLRAPASCARLIRPAASRWRDHGRAVRTWAGAPSAPAGAHRPCRLQALSSAGRPLGGRPCAHRGSARCRSASQPCAVLLKGHLHIRIQRGAFAPSRAGWRAGSPGRAPGSAHPAGSARRLCRSAQRRALGGRVKPAAVQRERQVGSTFTSRCEGRC